MRQDILEKREQILQWIEEEQPKSYICQQLHCKSETLNSYLKKMNIDYAGQQNKKGQRKGGNFQYISAMEYIQNNKSIKSAKLRSKLIREQLKPSCCEICGAFEWQGKKLPLELHHKNGNHFDNSFENLQILCPNCHSIQDGNSGANIGKYGTMLEEVDNSILEVESERSPSSNLGSATKQNYCIDCGKPISKHATRCKSCASKKDAPVAREELKKLLRELPILQIGYKYNVTDNAIRKWCDKYNLPRKSSEIKAYTDEEWKLI